MGEGVRELEDPSEGDGVIEPSSEAWTDSASCSDSATSEATFRDARVIMPVELSSFRTGLAAVEMRCLGASGGLLAAGVKSIIGMSAVSQLYCRASSSPRSTGIQVPRGGART